MGWEREESPLPVRLYSVQLFVEQVKICDQCIDCYHFLPWKYLELTPSVLTLPTECLQEALRIAEPTHVGGSCVPYGKKFPLIAPEKPCSRDCVLLCAAEVHSSGAGSFFH